MQKKNAPTKPTTPDNLKANAELRYNALLKSMPKKDMFGKPVSRHSNACGLILVAEMCVYHAKLNHWSECFGTGSKSKTIAQCQKGADALTLAARLLSL